MSEQYQRMLDKNNEPRIEEINAYIGAESFNRLKTLESFLSENYDLKKELKFPFGNSYGWGYKYSHKTKHLCYLFFEKCAFTVTIQIGGGEADKLNKQLDGFLPKTRQLWDKRYPCGNGGWVHYRVLSDEEIKDIEKLIIIKKQPLINSNQLQDLGVYSVV